MTVQQAIGFYVGYRGQRTAIDGREEVGCILNVCGSLRGVPHDSSGVGFEIADVAVGLSDQDQWISAARIVLESNGCVVGATVVRPGDVFFVEGFSNGTDIAWRHRPSCSDPGRVHTSVRQESG